MTYKKFFKRLSRALVRYVLYLFAWLVKWVPYPIMKGITNGVLSVIFLCVGRHRRIAKQSLDIAFSGEKSSQECNHILRRCFTGFGKGFVEMLRCSSQPKIFDDIVTIENIERLDQALAQEKGVIAVTAHFGNFPFMMMCLAHRGYKCNCIVRPMRDKKVDQYIYQKKEKYGLNLIYSKPAIAAAGAAIRALRKNEIVFIPVDQNFGSGGGVFVDFFGEKAATPTGPIVMAQRTGAVILPIFTIREKNDHHRIVIEEPYYVVEKETKEETLHDNMQTITSLVERYIRQYPSEWAWMHRRWKSQPQKK